MTESIDLHHLAAWSRGDIRSAPWSEDDRRCLVPIVARVLGHLDIDPSQQNELLGLADGDGLAVLLDLGRALPNSDSVRDRVCYLLRIYVALKLLYPQNPEIVRAWMGRAMPALGGQSPLDVMLSEGLSGLARVHDRLMRNLSQ